MCFNSTRCWVSWVYQQNLVFTIYCYIAFIFSEVRRWIAKDVSWISRKGEHCFFFFWKIRHSLTWSRVLFSPRFSAWKIMHWTNTCSKQVKAPWTCWGLWAIIYPLRTPRKLLQFTIKRLTQSILSFSFKVDMPTFNIVFFWERKRLPI